MRSCTVKKNISPDAYVIKNSRTPIVRTQYGKVNGYVRNGVYIFKGIPYGDDTSGSGRFMPPQKPQPWRGVRSCSSYGFNCPQPDNYAWDNDEEAWLFEWNIGPQNEDCLCLNIWTTEISCINKRPVMVWLHGGAFMTGSAYELKAYDGENISRNEDVVMVSLNHRLNAFGFLDLSNYAEKYAYSANVGMMDIVLALEWIKDNIAEFGGDPDCITIFGQSGGGGKICALMGMPSAEGLFHRAIIQSGSLGYHLTPDQSSAVTNKFLKALNIDGNSISRLQVLSSLEIVNAACYAVKPLIQPHPLIDFRHASELMGWAPVLDGHILTANAFNPTPSHLKKIPILVGSTFNEFTTAIGHPEYWDWTDKELITAVSNALKNDKIKEAVNMVKKIYPNLRPFQQWSVIASSTVRGAAIEQAKSKALTGGAAAYIYYFTWQSPLLDGRPMSFHCSEIPFVFNNINICNHMTGGGCDAQNLSNNMSKAWVNFARNGDPNHSGIPEWPAFTPENNASMVFDTVCEVITQKDSLLQQLIGRR